MRGKTILHQDQARGSLLRGVDLITNLVGPTLGPRGRHVVLQRFDAPPLVTNDGVTIARSVEMLQDPVTNQGVQLLREVASTAEDFLGDGTTTAMVLARAILHTAYQRVAEGASPASLCRGIDAAVADAGRVDPGPGPAAGGAGGPGSRGHDRLARRPHRRARGRRPDAGRRRRRGADRGRPGLRDQARLPRGDALRQRAAVARAGERPAAAARRVFEQPYILTADERITQVRQLVPVLSAVTEQRAPLVIVADEVSGDALTLLVVEREQAAPPGRGREGAGVRTRSPGRAARHRGAHRRRGGRAGRSARVVESAGLEQLGRADRVIATRADTTIVGGHGEPAAIAARARQAQAELAFLESEYEREKRRVRLGEAGRRRGARPGRPRHAGRAGGDATPHPRRRPGGSRRADRRDRARWRGDARCERPTRSRTGRTATRRPAARSCAPRWRRRSASSRPTPGIDPSIAVRRVRGSPPDHGIDIETDQPVDLVAAGIFDPAKIVRSTLEIAASVARDRACEPT